MALLSATARREIEEVADQIEKIETATEHRFQEHFVAAMGIPHTTAPFPHLSDILPADAPAPATGRRGRRRERERNRA